jgi:RecB family endonuclease NucS
MECLNRDPSLAPVRGIVAALTVAPQAQRYAESKGIRTVEIDYDELRGIERPQQSLFD